MKHDLFPRTDTNSKHRASGLSGRLKYESNVEEVEPCVSGEKSELKNCYSEPPRNTMN